MKTLFSIFFVLISLALLGCGFQPLYGTDLHKGEPLAAIEVGTLPDRTGVMLRNAVVDRLHAHGEAGSPAYRLTFSPLTESMSDLDVTVDEDTTRRQLRLSVTYTLTPLDGAGPLVREVYSIASFNVLQSRFTTRVAEDNARGNAVSDLAHQIERGIVLYLRGKK